MNTDIHFQISAPASLNIFGEHAKCGLRASIDLRTTLTFLEEPASLSNHIEIRFSQIKLLHKISLKDFSIFYEYFVKNMKSLHETVSQFQFQYESINQKIFLEIFYYLIVFIKYLEGIKIKPFIIYLRTEFTSNGEFVSLTSLKVCLVACLLHLSRLQKGANINTFDEIDLNNIYIYTLFCILFEKPIPESSSIIPDIMVCTYGSIVKYEGEQNNCERFRLPSRKILLVYLNQTQDVEAQKERTPELMNMFPELANSILNSIDIVTNTVYNIFKKISDIYKDNELSIKIKNDCFQQQYKAIEVSHNMNFIKKCCVVCLCIAAFSVSYFFS